MIVVRRIGYCRWRNRYAGHPVIVAELDTGGVDYARCNAPAAEALCGILGDRFPRLRGALSGRDATGLIANFALEFQNASDLVPAVCGAEINAAEASQSIAFFACLDEHVGVVAIQLAVAFVNKMLSDPESVAGRLVEILREISGRIESAELAPALRALAVAAAKRRIPWFRVGSSARLQFGQGHLQRQWPESRPNGGEAPQTAEAILAKLYPSGQDARIPTAMITGTKGKSTTALMLSSILSCAGYTVGAATSDGMLISGNMIARGDAAAVPGAEAVLRHPSVSAAVLETARGGLINQGIYLDFCDVAALLNIDREQIDMDGIHSLDDMARLKRKVLEAARRAIVLNADDPRCAAMAGDFPALRKIFFSLADGMPVAPPLVPGRDSTLFVRPIDKMEFIMLDSGAGPVPLVAIGDLPSCMDGVARHNVANAMAAAGLALGLGVGLESIAAGLRGYDNSLERSWGRMSFADGFPMPVIFDRAAQAPAYRAVLPAIARVPIAGRRICAVTMPGNRPDWAYEEAAAALRGRFELYVCFERPDYLRGRRSGDIVRQFGNALIAAGVPHDRVIRASSNREAADIVAREAKPGDLVVVFGSDVPASVREYREAFGAALPVAPVRGGV